MIGINLDNLGRILMQNVKAHDGTFCVCPACQAAIFLAIGRDLFVAYLQTPEGKEGVEPDQVEDHVLQIIFRSAGIIAEASDSEGGHERFNKYFAEGVQEYAVESGRAGRA